MSENPSDPETGQDENEQKEAHRVGTINRWDAPDASWAAEYDWTRYRGPPAYPVPGGWVLGIVEGDGTGWRIYKRNRAISRVIQRRRSEVNSECITLPIQETIPRIS